MNARIESMSHGDGKVYLQMVLDRLHPTSSVLLDARLKDGTKIPAHLFPFNPLEEQSQANYVVVLPHFDVREVDLTFLEYSGEGSPLTQSHLTVELNMMWWRTRFNALVHNELLEQMFDIEREYGSNRVNVFFTDAIDDGDEIVVKMLADMPHVEGADVMVDFCDQFGAEIDLPVYPLLDEVVAPTQFGEEERLHVGFSVRVSVAAKDFCVTVYDANELISGGFAQFCDETYEPLREQYLYCMNDASVDINYSRWFLRNCATLATLESQRKSPFPRQPLVSLVVPVYSGDECYMPACLGALTQQTYTRFEVVLACAGANEQRLADVLADWEGDSRITRLALDGQTDEGVARLTGMLQSKGEAVAVLSPRIILAPEALYEYVRCVNSVFASVAKEGSKVSELGVGSCDVVYANHDCFDTFEGLHSPSMKPSYSPDLLYSYNYMGPVVFYSRSVICAVQESTGFSSDAFDYDLALKACAVAKHVERIDKLLYHIQDAAPFSPQAESIAARREEETFRTGRKALANHLRRQGIEAVVLADVADRLYRVSYKLPEEAPSLAVVVIAGKEPELLDSCLTSIEESELPENTQVVVVECHETDRSTRVYCDHIARKNRAKVVIYEGNANRAAMVNAGIEQADSDYVLVLEGDGEMVGNQAISAMLAHCMRPDVAVVGAKLLFPDDTVRSAGLMVGSFGVASGLGTNLPRNARGYGRRYVCSSNVSAVSLSAMMFRRSVYDEVGGFDARFEVHPCEVDFCLKVAKAGMLIAFNGNVEVYRRDADTMGRASLSEAQLLRAEREKAFLHYRWPRVFVKGDPYMSAGLNPRVPYFLLNARS
jgi:O-antigen biosynthesis protein